MQNTTALFQLTIHYSDRPISYRSSNCKRTAQYILDEVLESRWLARTIVSIEVTRKGVLVPAMSLRPSQTNNF